jgi:TATA-binding protein-associated factor Taf7
MGAAMKLMGRKKAGGEAEASTGDGKKENAMQADTDELRAKLEAKRAELDEMVSPIKRKQIEAEIAELENALKRRGGS